MTITLILVLNMSETRVVNKYKEPYDIYIGRGSKWGNPFTHISDKKTQADFVVNSRDEAIESYREWIVKHLPSNFYDMIGISNTIKE